MRQQQRIHTHTPTHARTHTHTQKPPQMGHPFGSAPGKSGANKGNVHKEESCTRNTVYGSALSVYSPLYYVQKRHAELQHAVRLILCASVQRERHAELQHAVLVSVLHKATPCHKKNQCAQRGRLHTQHSVRQCVVSVQPLITMCIGKRKHHAKLQHAVLVSVLHKANQCNQSVSRRTVGSCGLT